MKQAILYLFLLSLSTSAFAQDDGGWKLFKKKPKQTEEKVDTSTTKPAVVEEKEPEKIVEEKRDSAIQPGVVNVHTDDRLTALLDKHKRLNEENGKIPGYRVQIYFGSGVGSRQLGSEARKEFMLKYRNIKAYEDYQHPNFKVKVGDFRGRLEAEKCKKEIAQHYPDAFIVPDLIELPGIKPPDED